MKQALIISLNFNPGHVSHLIASYKQFYDLGYYCSFYIDEKFIPFIPNEFNYIIYGKNKPQNADIAIFTFPSEKNIKEIIYLRRILKSKIIYIFHEPYEKMNIYRKAGFSILKIIKSGIINIINSITVKLADVILLPSQKALKLYDSSKIYLNKSRYYIPLMFDDEMKDSNKKIERKYFSYIGTVASDHSFNEFLNFIEWAILNSKLMNMKFMIATKSKINIDLRLQNMLASERLHIIEGTPLSNDEINDCYCSSFVVWNAYIRSTQSGVLAKAFMFGTPAITLCKNVYEYAESGKEVEAIDDNTSFKQIEEAVNKIYHNHHSYSTFCRKKFLETFYYKNYNEKIQEIIK